jgi:predicted GH43/DUF377 family glycosyl hydrolase
MIKPTLCAVALLVVLTCLAPAQINWTRNPDNPVFHTSSTNPYDPTRIQWAMDPSVLYDEAHNAYLALLFCWIQGTPTYSYSNSLALSLDGSHWFYYSKNPVISPSPDDFASLYINYPFVMKDAGGYKMYYTGGTGGWQDRIGLATSSNGFQWQKYNGNPILPLGPPGAWDSYYVGMPDVILVGQTYYMWYHGKSPDLTGSIGLATSTDGLVWTKHPANPVLGKGALGQWDGFGVGGPNVSIVNGIFYMAYGGASTTSDGKIGIATSLDGVTWQKYSGNPVLTPQSGWEGTRIGASSLLFRNNKFHLWYVGYDGNWQSGYATANLEYFPDQPNMIRNGSFETGTTPWTFYTNGTGTFSTVSPGTQGTRAGKISIGTPGTNVQLAQVGVTLQPNTLYRLSFDAYSNTGHDLTVYLQRNTSPYTNYGLNNFVCNLTNTWQHFAIAFTSSGFASSTSDSRLRFWFAPYDAAGDAYFVDNVVLSPASLEGASTERVTATTDTELPTQVLLQQNHPNPFNPSTTIEYAIPEGGAVEIEVLDVLGRRVATLVNEKKPAGTYTVHWDATGVSSGVYFYRLKTGDFVQTKRMLLLR